ncbi:hypothetical protein BKH42_01250 [Helicobacter sp. 13S00482-2]|uniref:hypothetical protein n=1 Tax=Helicobacter sp. 13S00482-2 TaxID=1476200 RepID=UPI000BA58ABE|nr:hypothetical protein [Helicobacter sp. 13S00482-2]PAF54562.1 hypothetical protein BKH42_01250 [Helicobacter sp. 13S00482-2]
MWVNFSSINPQSGLVANVVSSFTNINNKEAFGIKIHLKDNNHSVSTFVILAEHSPLVQKNPRFID